MDLTAPHDEAARKQRRVHVRVRPEPQHPIRVDVNGFDFMDIMYARDFSNGGLCVKVAHAFSRCHISLPMSLIVSIPEPVHRDMRLTGEIRHVEADIFGISFLDLSKQNRRHIRRYMLHRLRHKPWRIRLRFVLNTLFRTQ